MSAEEINQKIKEYSTFMNQVLRPELEKAESASDTVKTEIREFKELEERLAKLQKEKLEQVETMVDLGHKTIFCNAVAKVDTIFIHTGMGFHVEFTMPEAIVFVRKRISFLQKHALAGKEQKLKEVKDHIQSSALIFQELDRELQKSSRN